MRELFKRNHPSLRDYLYLSSKVSDFTIGDYTFEIGGRKKRRGMESSSLSGTSE